VMMMIAGGPGQASAIAFDLATLGSVWRSLFPGYTLVAFDPRGSGGSGFLNCSVTNPLAVAAEVTACGDALGPSRAFYTTAANAEDVDGVRQALGVDKVALWGTSYGTKVELAYALAHPDHVERMLLDSVVTPAGPDPLGLDTLQGIPLGLSAMCASAACRAIDPNLAAQVATIANRAAAKPITGRVRNPFGRPRSVTLDGPTLLQIVVGADLDPGLQAALPSVVSAATAGRPQALLRLADLGQSGFGFPRFASGVERRDRRLARGRHRAVRELGDRDRAGDVLPLVAVPDRKRAARGRVTTERAPAGSVGVAGHADADVERGRRRVAVPAGTSARRAGSGS